MANFELLSEILSVSGDVAYDWDCRADVMTWYGAREKFFGANAATPVNAISFLNAVYPEDRHLVKASADVTPIDRQYRLQLPDGRFIWVHERGGVECENDTVVRQNGVLRIIARNVETASWTEAYGYDALTGCLDRGHMLEQLARAMDRARDAQRQCAYLVVGIDKMSFVNEAVGMEAGDALLCSAAGRIAEIMPARAILGRVAGDMFGVLLPESIGIEYSLLAERLLQSFRDHPVITSVTPLHITVSIGGARLPMAAKNATEAMIFTEQALHDARQRGRNLFVEYLDSPERAQGNRQFLELAESIKHAFKNDGFRLAYQPIIDAQTGEVESYEALVRMFDDEGKPIPAALFVPAIEQLGLALDLDKRVLDMAVEELEASPDLTLAINVSGLTAAQASWPEYVQSVLGLRGDVARRMVFEITETAAIMDVSETCRFVNQIRQLGGKVALDDFGAGFTSIRHLRSLDISFMKIDKELLNNLVGHAQQQHLVRMLIELARGLGLKTIAEGIETEEIAAWLKREKVDMMQGYYFGKPSFDRPWAKDKEAAPSAPVVATPKFTVVAGSDAQQNAASARS